MEDLGDKGTTGGFTHMQGGKTVETCCAMGGTADADAQGATGAGAWAAMG